MNSRQTKIKALVRVFACVLFILTVTAFVIAQHSYNVTDLGTLGGTNTEVKAINSLGQITGASNLAGDTGGHAFLYASGKMNDLVSGSTENSVGTSINDDGQVVGISEPPMGMERNRAVMFTNGTLLELGRMGGIASYPNHINNAGQVVICAEGAPEGQAFLYNAAGAYVTSLTPEITATGCASAINNSGQMVGGYRDADGVQHAFLYSQGALTEIGRLGGAAWGKFSTAHAMNDAGQVVGTYMFVADPVNNSQVGRAFLYSNGKSIDIGDLGGGYAEPWAINNLGQIVGGSSNRKHPTAVRAFLLTPGRKMIDLNDFVPKHLGWTLIEAVGINDCGEIVANGERNGVRHAFLLSPRKHGRHNAK